MLQLGLGIAGVPDKCPLAKAPIGQTPPGQLSPVYLRNVILYQLYVKLSNEYVPVLSHYAVYIVLVTGTLADEFHFRVTCTRQLLAMHNA